MEIQNRKHHKVLRDKIVTQQNMEYLLQIGVRDIKAYSCHFTEGAFALILKSKVKKLCFYDCNIFPKKVRELLTTPSLKRFRLRSYEMPLTEDDILLPNLQKLNIGQENFNIVHCHIGFRTIPSLNDVRVFVSLSLEQNYINDEGVKSIICLSRLERLILNHNRISDRGVSYLIKLPLLHRLQIFGNYISDEGAHTLTKLKNLRRLNVQKNRIGPVGAAKLFSLRHLKRLSLNSHLRLFRKRFRAGTGVVVEY